jgi:hypothetical protein
MPMGKHYGSFAKGFADSLIAMMRLSMTMDLYKAREDYYKAKGWALTHPHGKAATQAELDEQIRQGIVNPNYGKGVTQADAPTPKGDGYVSMADMVKLAQNAGFQGDDAAHMAALAYAESQGHIGAVGSAGEIGLTQINPHAWGAEMANSARDPQGAFNAAYKVYQQQGWGAWSTDPSSPNFTPGNNGMRFIQTARSYIAPDTAKPTTTAGTTKPLPDKPIGTRTVKVSADEKGVKPGWDKIVNPTTPAEDKAAEAYKRAHPDWQKQYHADKPPERAQADQNVQVASLDDTAGLAEYLRLHPEAVRYQDLTEPGPPPKAAPPSDQPTYDPTTGEVIPPPEDPQGIRQRFVEQGMSGHPSQGETAYDPTTSRTRLYSAPDAYRPEDSPRPLPAGPQGPPQRPLGPMDPSIIARQRGIPPAPPPYGPQYTPPSVATTNLSERGTPYGSTGPMPARVASHPYPTPPESGFPPPAAAAMMPPRTTTPSTAYPPSTRQGPTLPSAADKPAPATQPVASPAGPAVTQPSNQFGGGRFTMVERPNIDVANPRSGGPPMMTALDLSHLWGPNPPLAQRAPQPPSPQGRAPASVPSGQIASPPGGGPTPYPGPTLNPTGRIDLTGGNQPNPNSVRSVPTPTPPVRPPEMDWEGSVATASRKGGPIQRFAKGGIPSRPTLSSSAMRYDAGGPSANTGLGGSADAGGGNYGWGGGGAFQPAAPTAAGTPTALGYQIQQEMDTLQYPGGAPPGRAYSYGANLDAMTPDQRTWMQNARTDQLQMAGLPSSVQQLIYNQLGPPPPTKPAAATPVPAPVAPTPTIINPPSVQNITNYPPAINDPTTTTTTGAPGLPTQGVKAKSYDPNVDAQTGAGFANTANAGGTNYSVGSNDLLKQSSPGTISGTPNQQILSRKGGPIQRFANGGIPSRPTMKFADAGVVPFTTQGYQGSRTPGEQYYFSPDYIGPTFNGWAGTPENQLAPNQQAWAQTTQGLLGQVRAGGAQDASYWGGGGQSMSGPVDTSQIFNQMTVMPNPIWPSTPNAPTPLNEPAPSAANITNIPTPIAQLDPTATTTTGIPGVPNIVQAKSYDPNVDAQTGASFANTSNAGGTNYAVGANDLLNQTTPGQISGNQQILSRKGGPLPKRGSQRYADGGGVDQSGDVSASALGMPPGLGQGGAQAIPPYYYNPATYAGAGAPVGKGVTQTSVPVYKAGAIPTLPMVRGGVVGYDDGGGVDPGAGDMAALQNLSYMDAQDEREDAQNAPAAAAPAPVTQYNAAGEPTTDVNPNEFLQPVSTGRDSAPPSDPTIPQVSDDQGNPSRGLIGAITSGLHWLGEHLGLVGGAQAHPAIATDPQTQDRRQKYATNDPSGETYFTHQNAEELKDLADPGHQLQGMYRQIAGLEQGWKWAMSRGDTATAGRLSAAFLHYSVLASQNLSKQAADALYNGDLKKSVDFTNQALDAVPDGRNIRLELLPDGQTVKVTGSTLTGQQLWQQYGAAPEILERATSLGQQGKLQWNALESQAAKYDHTFAAMQKNRQQNMTAGAKEQADKAAQEQANAQIAKMGSIYDDDGTAPPTAPSQPPPALTPVSTPALPGPGPTPSPGRSADMTTAQIAAPPPDSDSSLLAHGPTGHGGALPSAPSADIPAAGAQDVDLEHNVAYQQAPIQANMNPDGSPKYFTADMHPIVGGRPMRPPPPIDQVTFKSYAPQVQAAYREREQQYQQAVQQNQKLMQADIDGRRRDIAADITSRRDLTKQTRADVAAGKRTQAQIDAAAKLEANRQADTAKKEADAHKYNAVRALNPTELAEKLGLGKGGDDAAIRSDYLGRGLLAPNDYAATSKAASAANADPNTMNARLSQDYSPAELNNVWQAIQGTTTYTHDIDPNSAAELIGGAVNGYNKVEPGPPMATVDDGIPRTMLTITRPDGTSDNLVMRTVDAQNIRKVYDARKAVRDQQAEVEKQRAAGRQKEWDQNAPLRSQLNQPGGRFDVTPQQPAVPQGVQTPW